MTWGVIVGSGWQDRELGAREHWVSTPYGAVRLLALAGTDRDVFFCPRHGSEHSWPPHRINYRGHIWALWRVGVKRIVATATVGALHRAGAGVGDVVLVDQFLDYTQQRPTTFFDGPGVVHADVTTPYCPALRCQLAGLLQAGGGRVWRGGCYVCTEGPRYESAAEVRAYARLGGDVVGMTGMPEVALAREAGLCYAGVALVTNWGAGLTAQPLEHAAVVKSMEQYRERLLTALRHLWDAPDTTSCACWRPVELPPGPEESGDVRFAPR